MRWIVILLTLVGAAALVTASPVDAASCLAVSDEEAWDQVDALFIGTFVGQTPPYSEYERVLEGEATLDELVDEYGWPLWHFDVVERLKGDLGASVDISNAGPGGTPFLEFEIGAQYLVYAFYPDGGSTQDVLRANACGGIGVTPLTDENVASAYDFAARNASSCAALTDRAIFESTDVIFTGEIVDQHPSPERWNDWRAGTITEEELWGDGPRRREWSIEVTEVLKGVLTSSVVTSHPPQFGRVVPGQHLFFAESSGSVSPMLDMRGCGQGLLLDDEETREWVQGMLTRFGEPSTTTTLPLVTVTEATTSTLAAAPAVDGDGRSAPLLAVFVAALLPTVVVAGWLIRRSRRPGDS